MHPGIFKMASLPTRFSALSAADGSKFNTNVSISGEIRKNFQACVLGLPSYPCTVSLSDGRCYWRQTEALNWTQAAAKCAEHNGTLAAVTDAAVATVIQELTSCVT